MLHNLLSDAFFRNRDVVQSESFTDVLQLIKQFEVHTANNQAEVEILVVVNRQRLQLG